MQKLLFSLLASATLFISLAGVAAEKAKLKLTLDEAQKIAIRDNPSLATTMARIESAKAALVSAKSAYYPSLDLSAGVTKIRDYATRPDRDYDNQTNFEIGASLTYTLFDGFQRKYQNLYAQYNLTNAEETDQDARRSLLQTVASAFYATLLAQDSMDISKEDADFNKVLLEDAKKRKEGGIAKSSEVLNFILQVKNAEVDYISAEKTWRVSIVALAALLNISEDNIWENMELVAPKTKEYKVDAFRTLNDYAIQHRPDLRAQDALIQISRDGVEAARNSWYPSINLFANYGYEREDSIHYNNHYDRNINYGISATWNLFNGFKTTAQIAQAEAELTAAIKERDDLLINIESDIRQNVLALESTRKQYELQDSLLNTAKEIRDLVHQEYVGGTATITRLNEAQTDVTKAASSRSAAYMQYLMSIENLRATTAQNMAILE